VKRAVCTPAFGRKPLPIDRRAGSIFVAHKCVGYIYDLSFRAMDCSDRIPMISLTCSTQGRKRNVVLT
jgi:hypothetical protein